MMERIPAVVLGATGTVGQQFVRILAEHPWIRIIGLAASDSSSGVPYRKACRWLLPDPIPEDIADLRICSPDDLDPAPLVFSALPADIAGPVEEHFAAGGSMVCSNASSHRMDDDVPLLIPEVNPDQLAMLDVQRRVRGWQGGIVCSPNCSTTQLALALNPLHQRVGIEAIVVTTMQALSGAGYPGVPSLDSTGNVIPFIKGEEAKLQRETNKLLGSINADGVIPAGIPISATCTRVPVRHGHLMSVSLRLREAFTALDAVDCWQSFQPPQGIGNLPSTPDPVVMLREESDRPQPILDLRAGEGMAITIGRVRTCPVMDVQFVLLGHNTVRGAAGGAVHNAELLYQTGVLSI